MGAEALIRRMERALKTIVSISESSAGTGEVVHYKKLCFGETISIEITDEIKIGLDFIGSIARDVLEEITWPESERFYKLLKMSDDGEIMTEDEEAELYRLDLFLKGAHLDSFSKERVERTNELLNSTEALLENLKR